MNSYRFLGSKQWLAYLGLAAVFALACVLLSRWQMARLGEANAVLDRVAQNYDAPPLPPAQAAGLFAGLPVDREWQQARLRGTYDPAATRIVRNRPRDGQPGYEVLVPFRLDSGQAVVVDRGWLPIGNIEPGRPDAVPPPPSGAVEATVRLRPGEPRLDRGAPEGQLASIDLPAYAEQLPYPLLTGAYGQLATEDPPPEARPGPLPRPEPNNGMHLSYALQWLAFAVLVFIGFGYAARQQALSRTAEAGPPPAQERPRHHAGPGATAEGGQRPGAARPRKRRPTAEEEEDAILDAQGYG
jgi:cytochrome oxidase assembly protein ShyY1